MAAARLLAAAWSARSLPSTSRSKVWAVFLDHGSIGPDQGIAVRTGHGQCRTELSAQGDGDVVARLAEAVHLRAEIQGVVRLLQGVGWQAAARGTTMEIATIPAKPGKMATLPMAPKGFISPRG